MENMSQIFVVSDASKWTLVSTRRRRSLDTVYIDQQVKNKLVDEITNFTQNQALYERFGVPYKFISVFHGRRGSGKTTTIAALASYFQFDIAIMTLTPEMTSAQFEALVHSLPFRTFLVLEDVDTFDKKASGVSLETLLNCMDGLSTPSGMIAFLTTSHLSTLDPSLVRQGRVDLCQEFCSPSRQDYQQALNVLASAFSHEHDRFLENLKDKTSIAWVQRHLLHCIMSKKESIL